ncbi:MAG TPA: L,D-transpeptidase family protein [Trebonia sp.]|nr:L,D-transpeptidase family protein [Trebonia sp.]
MKTRMRGTVAGLAMGASALAVAAAMGLPGVSASAAPARPQGPGNVARPGRVPAPPKKTPPKGSSSAYTPPKRTLVYGDKGADVTALQHRLIALHYWPGTVNGVFDFDTQEAVYAFQGINGLTIDGSVGSKTAKALVSPRTYKAHDPGAATRVEVDIKPSVEVLVFYKNNKISLISHVSSGGGYYFCNPDGSCSYAVTPTGSYRANIFMPGWVTVPLGAMYNPVFFIGTDYAIHGDTAVPAYPASHGCVRIPDDIANWFYKQLDVRNIDGGSGTPIYVYSYNV